MVVDEFEPMKLLLAHFTNKSPLMVSVDQCEALLQKVSDEVAHFNYIKVQRPYRLAARSADNQLIGSLYVESIQRYGVVKFTLERSEQGWLTIGYKDEKRIVSTIDEIAALAGACQQVAEARQLETSKRQKIRALQHKIILAQVQKLARQEGFAYYTESDGASFKTYIRLANADTLKIAIPYEKFQETILTILDALGTLQKNHRQGVPVRAGFKESFGWRREERWILPDSVGSIDSE